jgi:hypothetical protein
MKKLTTIIYLAIAIFAFSCLGPRPVAQAVSPPPDGGYAGGNTAEGQNAFLSLTTGTYNTAIGFLSLESNSTGNFNTAVGAGTLLANTADNNTATGTGALLSNTSGHDNTATGAFALFSNTSAAGNANTASGVDVLFHNTTGGSNTASGWSALYYNTIGDFNTASGYDALAGNTTGNSNTAQGVNALDSNTTGSNNTAVGFGAGANATTGSNNVYIGAGIEGLANDDTVCRIGSIFGATITSGVQVLINSDNRLGTMTSSKRFKQNIIPTSGASEALYKLQPVTFQYKKEIDPEARRQFGLVAEDVEKVNPDLVVHDKDGKPYSVRYDQVNAMLLNEFLKEHRRIEEQESRIDEQENMIAAQREEMCTLARTLKEQVTEMQNVNTRLARVDSVPQLVVNAW